MAETTTGWRPIAEAPKDARHVLVGRAGVRPIRAWFEGGRWWMHGRGPYDPAPANLMGSHAPTHWMELPAPPLDLSTAVEG